MEFSDSSTLLRGREVDIGSVVAAVLPGSWPWTRVRVVGPSMVPALRHGDLLVVRRTADARPGDVVVASFPDGPDLLVVKRAVRAQDGGWWLRGDNPLAGDDSERYGVGVVLGRVVGRYWPPRSSR